MESDILRQHSLAISHWPSKIFKPHKTMTLEQLLVRACAVMTDNQWQEEPIVAAAHASRNNIKASTKSGPHTRILCNGEGHRSEQKTQCVCVCVCARSYRCNKAGHIARDCPGNEDGDEMASISSLDNLWMRCFWWSESTPMRRHAQHSSTLATIGRL